MSLARDIADLGSSATRLDTEGANFKNLVINGGQTVDQRNSGSAITLTSSHQYATDRFICRLGTSSSSTAQRVADAPNGFYNSVKITIGTGATPSAATATGYFAYKTEGLDVSHLNFGSSAAQTVTLSFYVKSSLTGSFGVTVANDALNRSFPSSYTINSANTWERKSITVTGDNSGTWVTTNAAAFYLLWDLGCGSDVKGTANTWAGSDFRGGATGTTNVCATSGATWQITGVQLEVGDTATDFEHRSFGDELARCQRYYHRVASFGTFGNESFKRYGYGTYYSTTAAEVMIPLPVTMRAEPSFENTGTSTDYAFYDGTVRSISSNLAINAASDPNYMVITGTTASTTLGNGAIFLSNSNTNSFIAANAEL